MSPDFFTLLEEQLVAAAERDPKADRGRTVLAALPVAAALFTVALIAIGLVLVLGGEEQAPQRRAAVPPIPPARVATTPSTGAPPVRVYVLNGTAQNGLAATAAKELEIAGATVVGTATAGRSDVATSSLYVAAGVDPNPVRNRLRIPKAPRPLTAARRRQAGGADILVVLGADYQPSATTATTGPSGAAGFPQQQINLTPPDRGRALGFALLAEGGLALQADHLPKSDLYGVYLFNSRADTLPLGFAQYDAKSKHVAGAITALPAEAARYREVVIARQPGRSLDAIGRIVLRGRIRR